MASGETIWENFLANIKLVIEQINDGDSSKVPEKFDSSVYWTKLGDVFKLMSHEATKMSMAFSKPPYPSNRECESLIASVEKTALALVSLYYSLPKTQGLTLRQIVKSAALQILEGIKSLAETVRTGSSEAGQEQYQGTGTVWEAADNFRSLPRDNKAAVTGVLKKNAGLVQDALLEMEEAVENEGQEDEFLHEFLGDSSIQTTSNETAWTDEDKKVIGFCQGLVKTTKTVLKKTGSALETNGQCDSEGKISQLDDLADHIEGLSPVVDEVASSIYPPLNRQTVIEQSHALHQLNTKMLNFLKHSHLTTEGDEKWVEFLLKASLHNWTKVEELCAGSGS